MSSRMFTERKLISPSKRSEALLKASCSSRQSAPPVNQNKIASGLSNRSQTRIASSSSILSRRSSGLWAGVLGRIAIVLVDVVRFDAALDVRHGELRQALPLRIVRAEQGRPRRSGSSCRWRRRSGPRRRSRRSPGSARTAQASRPRAPPLRGGEAGCSSGCRPWQPGAGGERGRWLPAPMRSRPRPTPARPAAPGETPASAIARSITPTRPNSVSILIASVPKIAWTGAARARTAKPAMAVSPEAITAAPVRE